MHAGNWALLLWLHQVNILLGFECFVHTLRSGVADFLEQSGGCYIWNSLVLGVLPYTNQVN